jgi:hypothetical protein
VFFHVAGHQDPESDPRQDQAGTRAVAATAEAIRATASDGEAETALSRSVDMVLTHGKAPRSDERLRQPVASALGRRKYCKLCIRALPVKY